MSKSPQRNVIRHARIAHRAEKNRVEGAKLREAVVGHHLSRLDVGFAAPVKMRERIIDAETPARGFEHAQSFGHDFFSNAIAGNHCNLVGFHGMMSALQFLIVARLFRGEAIAANCTTQPPALKALCSASPGQRPGYRNECIVARPERARGPSAPSGRTAMLVHGSRGVAPGCHASRRWRDNVALLSSGENLYNAIYKMTVTTRSFRLATSTIPTAA